MIGPATGCFEIFEVPTFDLGEVTGGNDEYIDNSSARVSQFFNNTCLSRHPRPRKVVFDKRSEFKQYFNPLLKDSDIKPVLTTIKNPQDNASLERVHQVILAPLERVHQVILNRIVTKYISNKVFDYIYPWGKMLVYIA